MNSMSVVGCRRSFIGALPKLGNRCSCARMRWAQRIFTPARIASLILFFSLNRRRWWIWRIPRVVNVYRCDIIIEVTDICRDLRISKRNRRRENKNVPTDPTDVILILIRETCCRCRCFRCCCRCFRSCCRHCQRCCRRCCFCRRGRDCCVCRRF